MATSPNFSTNNDFIKYRITVTENSQDIANNTTNITVKVDAWRTNTGYTTYGTGTCYCNINGTNYSDSISSSQRITHNSHTVLFNRTVNITHDADGKKTIYVSAYIRHSQFSSNSQGFNVVLTDIPRQAIILSGNDFFDYANPTITYSNPAGVLVDSLQACISLDNSTPLIAYRDIDKLGTSYTFELTTAERNALLQSTPNSNHLDLYYIIKTVIAGVTYYSSLSAFMGVKESLASPVITGVTYEDTNADTLAITSDSSKIIQAISTVRFNFASLTAQKFANLASVSVTVNGITVNKSLSGSTASNESLAFGTINSSSNLEALVTVTDTRGNSSTATVNITMLEWKLPTATLSLNRKNNYYSETYLTVVSSISSLDGNNAVTITYQYKEKSASTYSNPVTIQDGVTVTLNIDNTKTFDFKITVADRIGQTIYNKVLYTGLPILFIDRLLRSIGAGAIPDQSNMLCIDRRINLKNVAQESVADLWSNVYGSANFRLHRNNITVVELIGTNNGGYFRIRDANGANGVYLDNTLFRFYNEDGAISLDFFTGGLKDGVINVNDHTGNTTISLTGETGEITAETVNAKRVKTSEQIIELFDGATPFYSGSKVFDYDGYNSLTVIAKVTNTSSFNLITIPVKFLESTEKRFCISDEINYVVVRFSIDTTTNKITMTWDSRNSTGYVDRVYGNY